MISISVVIITLNEEKNLPRCLEAVRGIADEIVVVDSLSKDNTVVIAKRYNARVVEQAFLGYGAQKNFANDCATNNWILSLDADEVLTPELIKSIKAVKQNPTHNAYQLTRLTNYCGKWIRHCGWYPDKKTRLFDRTKGKWEGDRIHEHWEPFDKKEPLGLLKGDLNHYSYYTISDHVSQIEKFTEISAKEAADKGNNVSFLKLAIGPRWIFITMFFLRLGFLDGYAGYLVCRLSAYAAFIKYAKIRQYSKMKKKN